MTPPNTPVRLPAWAPFVVLALAFVAQAAVLQGGWLLDDDSVIRADADIARGPAGIPRVFARGTLEGEMERGAYRPLMLASFALEAPLWSTEDGGFDPFGFHLTNLLLHAVAALLLLSLLLRLLPTRPYVALGAALVFAAHPMNTGTIGSLLGRADLLALVFSLAAARLWVRPGGLGVAELAWIGLFAFLALMAKEVALALPVVLVLFDLAGLRQVGGSGARARLPAYGVLALVVGVYLVLWSGPAEGPLDLPRQSTGLAVLLGLAGAARMLLRFVLPIGYRGDHSDEALGSAGYTFEGATALAAGLAVLLAVVALVVLLRRRRSPLAFAWLLTVVTSAVAAATLPAGGALELRFAYIAGVPLFAMAGLALEALAGLAAKPGIGRLAGAAGAIALLLGLGGLAHVEAKSWRDDATYHDRLLRESPGHVGALVRQARLERRLALSLQARASQLPTTNETGGPNAELYRLRKQRQDALNSAAGWLQRALNRPAGRQLASAWAELGFVRLARGEPADALAAFDEAKRHDPVLKRESGESLDRFTLRQLEATAEIYYAEGKSRKALGDAERASSAFQSAIGITPTNSAYLKDAAMALMEQRRWGEGLPLLQQAIRYALSAGERQDLEILLKQQTERASEFAARLYQQAEQEFAAGNREAALAGYQQVFLADPEHVDAYIRAARIIGSYMGNYARGNKYLLQAERIVKAKAPVDTAKLEEIRKWRRFLAERKKKDDEQLARELEADRKREEERKRKLEKERGK
ncbi:MAG: hypothetical protein QNJ98_11955 [Planctomycetota bacterium]|nr:hypothetical protein [Planctomycetota bacterium]